MTATLQTVLDRLRTAYRRGSPLVLLFDYDGTLSPIVEHPRMAALDRDTERLLASLAGRPGVSLGILSGRQLDDLKTLVRLPDLYLAGTGGLELDLRGVRVEHPQAERTTVLVKRLAAQLDTEMAAYQGAWLEKKRLGLTVHYRNLPGHLLAPLQAVIEEVTQYFTGELRIVQGPRAWEITPAWGWTKGTAVRLILTHLGVDGDAILYAGDEVNDVEAMETVVALGGITLGIGPNAPSAAEHRLPSPDALRTLLGKLDASLGNVSNCHVHRNARLGTMR